MKAAGSRKQQAGLPNTDNPLDEQTAIYDASPKRAPSHGRNQPRRCWFLRYDRTDWMRCGQVMASPSA
jgi:hypothetical protein